MAPSGKGKRERLQAATKKAADTRLTIRELREVCDVLAYELPTEDLAALQSDLAVAEANITRAVVALTAIARRGEAK